MRRRKKPRASRPARVPTPGLSGRLGDLDCSIGNLSPRGALLLTVQELQLDSVWSLQLNLPSGAVKLTCRVVRCESMEVQLQGAVWRRRESAIGVAFEQASEATLQAIERVCVTAAPLEEAAPRVLVISRDLEFSKTISSALADADYVPRIITELREAPSVARKIGAKAAIVNVDGGQALFEVVDGLRSAAVSRTMPIVGCATLSSLSDRQRSHLSEQRVRLLALPLTPEELIDAVDRAVLEGLEA
ncbi:MAG TPA: PilZ domain-containing protein [Vicinamibacterales bacterium]